MTPLQKKSPCAKGERPAFPTGAVNSGLTKREYMATAILAGMGDVAPDNDDGTWGFYHEGDLSASGPRRTQTEIMQHKAQWAARQADALIAALGGE